MGSYMHPYLYLQLSVSHVQLSLNRVPAQSKCVALLGTRSELTLSKIQMFGILFE